MTRAAMNVTGTQGRGIPTRIATVAGLALLGLLTVVTGGWAVLALLEGVDFIAVYWMGPAIAHTFVSFAFGGDDHLAISIETRKEKGEGYFTIKGFFRQYERYYVVADERDVIRLRTNYRRNPPEQVYVYRVQAPIENGQRVFVEYMKQINALGSSPRIYNTLVNAEHLPFSWRMLASGYVPEYLYRSGRLDTSVPFPELKRRAHVNARSRPRWTHDQYRDDHA